MEMEMEMEMDVIWSWITNAHPIWIEPTSNQPTPASYPVYIIEHRSHSDQTRLCIYITYLV